MALNSLIGGNTSAVDVFFTLPNTLTGGMYVNIWLIGVYGVVFIGATQGRQRFSSASLLASFVTFIVTFLLVLFSSYTSTPVAGGTQLIFATVVLMGNIVWNYIGNGGLR